MFFATPPKRITVINVPKLLESKGKVYLLLIFIFWLLFSLTTVYLLFYQRVISAVSMHTTFASLSGSKPFADVIQILVGKSLNKYLIAMKVLI